MMDPDPGVIFDGLVSSMFNFQDVYEMQLRSEISNVQWPHINFL